MTDHQYLRFNVLDFFHRDSDGSKSTTTCKSTTVGWVWPGVPSDAQTCLNLPGGEFGWSRGCIATLKIIHNEKLIKF